MRNGITLLAIALLISGAAQVAQAQGTVMKDPKPKPVLIAPDLIPDGIGYKSMGLYEGKIELIVTNVGQKTSVQSLVRILITMPGQSQSMGWSATVRALEPGQTARVPISTGKPLNLARYCVIADALKQNKESDETNNERCGQFDGKP